ncbi:MAG: TolC family protein [Bacteroidota bacterium]
MKQLISHILRLIVLLSTVFMPLSGISQENDSLLDLQTCKQMAMEHNRKIKMADLQINMAEQNRKSAFTSFFPDVDLTAQYLRTNNSFRLLDENMFFPVVPFWAIDQENMSLVPEVEENPLIYGTMIDAENFDLESLDPANLDLENLDPETWEVMYDDEGNPVFLQYGYIPSEEMTFGSRNNYIINGGITQPIYLGGKIRSQYRIAKITKDIQKQRKSKSEDEILYEVEKVYWKIVSLQEKKEMADTYKTMLDTLVKDLENILDEGIITRNDLLKARKKQNEVVYQQFRAKNGIRLASMALNQLIGRSLDSVTQVEGELGSVRIFTDRDNMIQQAIEKRPELEMIDKSVELADESVKLAWSRFLPNIIGTANYTYYNPNPYNGFTEEFGGDYNLGITCRIPITSWGDRVHSLKAAKQLRELSDLNRKETQEKISLEVQQGWNTYLEAFEKVNVKEKGLEQAEENLRIMQDKFDEGMITTSDLLEAQALWQEAYAELIEAKTELRTKEIEIKKLSGQL